MNDISTNQKMSERKGTRGLELWCKRLVKDYPNVQIDNMTTSWRNGIAFCALVHHFRPDLIEMSKLKPENIYENNQLAFSIAEKELGIPALLDPEDMVENEIPDRLSILTYLSQFYRHLGHKVKPKASVEGESKVPPEFASMPPNTPIQFGKTGLDKCAACGLPVYLAQRLIISHKLYHRRCFRCSKCSGHLNPKNFHIVDGSEFQCDSCKNDKILPKFLNNNEQMGMLAYNDDTNKETVIESDSRFVHKKQPARPLSILEKINMFEKGVDHEEKLLGVKLDNISIKDTKEYISINSTNNKFDFNRSLGKDKTNSDVIPNIKDSSLNLRDETVQQSTPSRVYKSNLNQFNFLQTQLTESGLSTDSHTKSDPVSVIKDTTSSTNDCTIENSKDRDNVINLEDNKDVEDLTQTSLKEVNNVTDDSRIGISQNSSLLADTPIKTGNHVEIEEEISISVPPRRKKQLISNKLLKESNKPGPDKLLDNIDLLQYPDHLNPFGDEEDIDDKPEPKKISTNPFGSSDEEDDDVPPIPTTVSNMPVEQPATSMRRLISANPFWSDGEEPSSEEEEHDTNSNMYSKSSLTTSTPNLPSSTPRRKKVKAPPPPPPALSVTSPDRTLATSNDDVASISSVSSYNSTAHSDQKSFGKSTPILKKKRLAPTPPDSLSTVSTCEGSMEKGVDSSGTCSSLNTSGLRRKGPAPGLPLPERREVKLHISPEELQVQLDMLETQQLGLERQGVLIEQMIRQKCEGEDACTVSQEEVEDLVIQLCEIVNEKNDLFRKQTELMYIRRQQRLEQEQADIEHEIRILQSRPAVNRIDADKVREEQLVTRLVAVVRSRDELVQQLDAERRRERQEDLAIAASIANKRAQRNSDSSSLKSTETTIVTPKKSKMKDKVKKQFKKAKHTFISKKKDDSTEPKEGKEGKSN